MLRRRPRTHAPLLTLTLVLLWLLPAQAQQDLSGVEIETVDVGPGLWMLVGAGGNIGVSAGEDGAFLIDDQYAPLTEKIRAAVAKLGKGDIRFVLNTHWHGDHTGGNENLGKAGTLIVAHDNVRQSMSVEHFSKVFNQKIEPSPKEALPVVTFNDTVTFHLNGETIHAFHVDPAHTNGDSIVHFKTADAVHMGDVYFNGMYPFIDVESGGSLEGVIAATGRVLDMIGESTKVIPGHGPLSNRQELAAYRSMLQTVEKNVKPLIAEGKSREEVIAAKPTADLDETWGKGFMKPDVFVGIVYDSLSK